MIGEKIEEVIKNVIREKLSESKNIETPDDIIETDNISEVIEKISILHCRLWYLEDRIGELISLDSKSDIVNQEIVDLKHKIDICFKLKRPKYIEAINRMIDKAIIDGKSLVEDSVKLYKGYQK